MKTENVKNQYNEQVKGGYDYEYNRWHKNSIQEAGYQMTLGAIKRFALPLEFETCLELGPGHGTWTNEFLKVKPNAKYLLLDISREMLSLARKRFSEKQNIEYMEADFLEFGSSHKFDLFFSSRAIEYIPQKEKVVEKMVRLIKPGGHGFVITKTPKYFRMKLMGKNIPEFHSGQISPTGLKVLLKNLGAKDIKIYPVTFVWPLFESAFLNNLLHRVFGRMEINKVSEFFSESYCVIFNK